MKIKPESEITLCESMDSMLDIFTEIYIYILFIYYMLR